MKALKVATQNLVGLLNLLICTVTSSCSNRPAEQHKVESVSGIGGIKLGENFENLISKVDLTAFNSVSVSECLRDIATQGCYLTPASDETIFTMEDNIPYSSSLSINRLGRLTDLTLSYRREKDITKAECVSVLERTVNWASKKFGSFTIYLPDSNLSLTDASTTPNGNKYFIVDDDEENAISQPMRTRFKESRSSGIIPTKRHASVLLSFITVDRKPMCSVDLTLSEPDSVTRTPTT